MKVCIAKLRKSGKIHCSGQGIVLILDTTSDLLESVSKILVENWLHSQVFRANCIWQSEWRELFARIVRVSVKRPYRHWHFTGSVAAHLRCGWLFSDSKLTITNFLPLLTVKNILNWSIFDEIIRRTKSAILGAILFINRRNLIVITLHYRRSQLTAVWRSVVESNEQFYELKMMLKFLKSR